MKNNKRSLLFRGRSIASCIASMAAVIGVLSAPMTAPAQIVDGFIGKPSGPDYFKSNAQGAIEAAVKANVVVKKFDPLIAAARAKYFQSTGSDKEAAGAEFGKLLFYKDMILGNAYIVEGVVDHGNVANKLISAFNGGKELDAGIPPGANNDYLHWIEAVRKSLGAKGRSQLLIFDQASLAKALDDSMPEYQIYRRMRDLSEAARWKIEQSNGTPTEPYRRPLFSSLPIDFARFAEMTLVTEPKFREQAAIAARAGAKVLRCDYGPGILQGRSSPYGYNVTFYFWQNRTPDNIAELLAYNRDALNSVKDHAAAACPLGESEAYALETTQTKVVISPELRKQADDIIAAEVRKNQQVSAASSTLPPNVRLSAEADEKCWAARRANPPSSNEEFSACRREAGKLLSQGRSSAAEASAQRTQQRLDQNQERINANQERMERRRACAETRNAALAIDRRDNAARNAYVACVRSTQ
jgi:hypothetical protein